MIKILYEHYDIVFFPLCNLFVVCTISFYTQIFSVLFTVVYFVPICNFDKPISATQCFIETNDMVIDPLPEYFNDNISPCDSNARLTCNSFTSDQSFKSNLTGRIYKTQTYEQLTCGSLNVVYTIHYIRCGLMYVSETGRSLRSRINGH